MYESKYVVSVIIPFYNAEDTLNRCLASLTAQVFKFSQIEIILVNDGSEDSSSDICAGYTSEYSNFVYIEQEHSGVSAARNRGIEAATGRYVMFLDADDYLGKNAIEKAVSFFDKRYDDVDVVSFHEIKKVNGNLVDQMRNKYLKKTGVYDLGKYPFALQLRISIIIKNGFSARFDEGMVFQEDQKFCAELLKGTMKLGYVANANYYYDVKNDSSVSMYYSPITSFETTVDFFEKLFAYYLDKGEEIPAYFQAQFFHDCSWKFKDGKLWPYHYSPEDLDKAKNRVKTLLRNVDSKLIMDYPLLDAYEKLYWIRQKDEKKLTGYPDTSGVYIFEGRDRLYNRNKVEIILCKIRVENPGIYIRAHLKSPLFSLSDKPVLQVDGYPEPENIELIDCAAGYYKTKEKNNVFWGFEYRFDLMEEKKSVDFLLTLNGIPLPVSFYNMPTVEFSSDTSEYLADDILVKQGSNNLVFYRMKGNSLIKKRAQLTKEIKDKQEKMIKMTADSGDVRERIWLYSDLPGVACDNAYYQFLNDIGKEDGIQRFYVVSDAKDPVSQPVVAVSPASVVKRGSSKHIELFFNAEKILTSFIEEDVYWPIDADSRKRFRGMFNAEIVYLQHGVLHARLPWYYSKYKTMIDKIVVSSSYEKNTLTERYDYLEKDIIPCGMSRLDRYDGMLTEKNSESTEKSGDRESAGKRVIFAPSWRSYLIITPSEGGDREPCAEKLTRSRYFEGIKEFLQSEKLLGLLRQNNIRLDYKLHPEFEKTYGTNMIVTDKGVISEVNGIVDFSVYDAIITDFSSLLYDFVYQNKPVIYYVTDYDEFRCGMNHYRELEVPVEDGMGELALSVDEAVSSLKKVIDNDFEVLTDYREKYRNFFFDVKGHGDMLYDSLVKPDKE